MKIVLTSQQQKFHDNIIDWIHERNNLKFNEKYIVGSGFAGTGKTTILGEILDSLDGLGLTVSCASYTGKASQVLKSKITGHKKEYCGTIHGLIYRPKVDKDGKLLGFVRRTSLTSDVIIIDECSMINKNIFKDLIKYRKPIIFIGDDAQLPPVGGEEFDIFKNTIVKLTEIHRQAEHSPIIKMSMIVRNEGKLKMGIYGKNCARFSWKENKTQQALYNYDLVQDNIVLCGTNRTRIILNQLIRDNLGFKKNDPMKKEKIVCLVNNHKLGIMNGNVGEIESIKFFKDYAYIISLKSDCSFCNTDHFVYKPGFNEVAQKKYFDFLRESKYKIKKDLQKEFFDKLDLFDFGYAISVHKSQGSTFENVILINERNYYQTDNDYCRWLYTGITRASKKLLIVDDF